MKGKNSEKRIETSLVKGIEKKGGWCLKFLPFLVNGLPDRICLLPGGVIKFVETKTKGDRPRKIQTVVHNKLKALGFEVYIISEDEELKEFLKKIDNEEI